MTVVRYYTSWFGRRRLLPTTSFALAVRGIAGFRRQSFSSAVTISFRTVKADSSASVLPRCWSNNRCISSTFFNARMRRKITSTEMRIRQQQHRRQHQSSQQTEKCYPVPVTVLSSIPRIASSIAAVAPELRLIDVVCSDSGDEKEAESLQGLLHGDGDFDVDDLSTATREMLVEAEILITEPAVLARILAAEEEHLSERPLLLPNLKWCQSTYAGVDAIFKAHGDAADEKEGPLSRRRLRRHPDFTLTRMAGKFGPPIAEWCMARIVGHERHFAASAADQVAKTWPSSLRESRGVFDYRYLSDLTLVVLGGCGDIGSCVTRVARDAFGMRTVGFTRSERKELPDGLDEIQYDLNAALRQADYLVSALPSTQTTRGLLSGEALAACAKAHGGKCPAFLNVGRGDVTDEESIVRALDGGYISAAILDVFETEPLPTTSRLWERPDVVISPHVSAITRGKDVPDVFLENYRRYVKGRTLNHVVDWEKGY